MRLKSYLCSRVLSHPRTRLVPALLILTGAACAQIASGWRLVWSDEFNGAAGSAPDLAEWNYDLGGGGVGQRKIETYTNSTKNTFQDGNGNLVIRAIRSGGGAYTAASTDRQPPSFPRRWNTSPIGKMCVGSAQSILQGTMKPLDAGRIAKLCFLRPTKMSPLLSGALGRRVEVLL